MRTQSISLALVIVLICPYASADWVQTNGPYGGDIRTFGVLGPNLFVGTYAGGVFRSTNSGTGWTAANTGLPSSRVMALEVSGTNLFAGTGNGVSLSTNGGASWTTASRGLPAYCTVSALAVIGANLVARADWTSDFTGGFLTGVFHSTDNGASWVNANGIFATRALQAIAVYGSTILAGTGPDVFLSSDSGRSWTAVNIGITNTVVNTFAVSGTNLFAGTNDGVFLCTKVDTGWTGVNLGLANTSVSTLAIFGGNLLAATDYGVFLFTNNGTSWTAVNTGLAHSGVGALAITGENLFAGTYYGGVFRSSNYGRNWTAVNSGLTNTTVQTVIVSGANLFAGTDVSGVFRSTDGGTNWTAACAGLTNTKIRSLAVSSTFGGVGGTTLLAGTNGDGVFLSTNFGTSWTAASSGLLAQCDVEALALSGTNLFAGTDAGVFLSTDGSTSWTAVDSGLPSTTYVLSFAASPASGVSGGTDLFAGAYSGGASTGGVFLSTNNGTSWTSVSPGYTVYALAVSGDCLFAGTDGGVFFSTDGGTIWTGMRSGLTNPYVRSLVVSSPSSGTVGTNLFAGTSYGGVFLSTNNGTSWTKVNKGLTSTYVGSLAVSGTDLIAGTLGGGVWRRPLSEMISSVPFSSGELPTQFSLKQNYPNPFNPSTTINFELPNASHVTLMVYDILGREVSVLVNEKGDAGVHEVKCDGSNLASGVYFYRLQAGDYVASKKMLVLK